MLPIGHPGLGKIHITHVSITGSTGVLPQHLGPLFTNKEQSSRAGWNPPSFLHAMQSWSVSRAGQEHKAAKAAQRQVGFAPCAVCKTARVFQRPPWVSCVPDSELRALSSPLHPLVLPTPLVSPSSTDNPCQVHPGYQTEQEQAVQDCNLLPRAWSENSQILRLTSPGNSKVLQFPQETHIFWVFYSALSQSN